MCNRNLSVMLYGLYIHIVAPLAFSGIDVELLGARMTDASSKIDVRRLTVGDLQLKILVQCALLCLVFLVLGRS